jgi:hypothetical protein
MGERVVVVTGGEAGHRVNIDVVPDAYLCLNRRGGPRHDEGWEGGGGDR